MDIIKLVGVFIIILVFINRKKSLFIAMLGGVAAVIIFYQISFSALPSLFWQGLTGPATINLVLSFYFITFLQRMMEKRKRLMQAEMSINRLFNNPRLSVMLVPFVIGLLPSPGAVLIAAPIVDKTAGDSLNVEEKCFVTSYFRHISEAFLPTYASILLAIELSGQNVTSFVFWMLPMVFVLFFLGYLLYVRKIPKSTADFVKANKAFEMKEIVQSLWPIAVGVLLILFGHLPVFAAVLIVLIINVFVERFTLKELKPMIVSAFEYKLIFSSIAIMIFKEMLSYTGVITELPVWFQTFPISPAIIFALIFFFGTLVAGGQSMIAIVTPVAFVTVPQAGIALLVLLMSMSYIAAQISPTHICLSIVVDYFKVSFGSLIKKTIPVLLPFIFIVFGYYYLMLLWM